MGIPSTMRCQNNAVDFLQNAIQTHNSSVIGELLFRLNVVRSVMLYIDG